MKTLKAKIKNEILFSLCRPGCLLPRYPNKEAEYRKLFMRHDQVTELNDTTNNVLKVDCSGTSRYFRKCSPHLSKRDYANSLIEDFYRGDPQNKTKEWILRSLSDRTKLRRFFDMGVTNDKFSRVSRYYETGNPELVGIDRPEDEDIKDGLLGFFQFAWGEIYNYHLNSGLRNGQYQIYNSSRQFATKAVADAVGLSGLIPDLQYGYLVIDGQREIFGTLMENAPGRLVKWETQEKRRSMITPALQHALNNLNLLDVICFERDHKPSNYHVITNSDDEGIGVCAFDNDSPLTFFPQRSAEFATYMKCSPYVRKGFINRPYADRNIASAVLGTSAEELAGAVREYLSRWQINAMKSRFRQLQLALKNSSENGRIHLLSDEEWSKDTIVEELGGKYGKTYLTLFGDDLKLPRQYWINNQPEN